MKRIAIFASGNGSNFQTLVDACEKEELQAEVCLLVCDNPNAKVIEKASQSGIEAFVFMPKTFPEKSAFEEKIVETLIEKKIDFIVLAGYMRLIGHTLLSAYEGKIVNIHPSLLPAFPGKRAMEQALESGRKITGVTIHYVDEGMDTGPIIAQQAVIITRDETLQSLEQKIHKVEHRLYPETLNKLFAKKECTENGYKTSIN